MAYYPDCFFITVHELASIVRNLMIFSLLEKDIDMSGTCKCKKYYEIEKGQKWRWKFSTFY